MRHIKRLRKGMLLRSNIDGAFYRIVDMDGDDTAFAKETGAAFHDLLKNGRSITITSANKMAFSLIDDPDPYPVPHGYTAEGGILLKYGEPACEQGEIYVERVIAAIPSALVLAVKPKSKQDNDCGYIDLFFYEPEEDSFKCSDFRAIPIPTVIGYSPDKSEVFLAYSENEKMEENTHSPIEKEACHEKFKRAAVFAVKGEQFPIMTMSQELKVPIILKDAFIATEESVWGGIVCKAFLPFDYDGRSHKRRCWMEVGYRETEDTFFMDGKPKASWSGAYQTIVLRTKNEVYVNISGMRIHMRSIIAAEVAEKYPFLIRFDGNEEEYRATFSDENYNFTTVVSRKTSDRGNVIGIE